MHETRIYSIAQVEDQIWISSETGEISVWNNEDLSLTNDLSVSSFIRCLAPDLQSNHLWCSCPAEQTLICFSSQVFFTFNFLFFIFYNIILC